ncbi:hypothetical protein F5Y18DRAFT_35693 [Xylariaceae sp. FL1019]|nr:hypothetical protein F5Y18DRAFT_35693 [Xylariaceae sp. FL1019]
MTTRPIFISPALPTELLSYILQHHAYPTTLIICSSRTELLNSLSQDVQNRMNETNSVPDEDTIPAQAEQPPPARDTRTLGAVEHALVSSPLHQIATSRHIRIIYTPTVTHLRAYLSVFTPEDSRAPIPPAKFQAAGKRTPHLILYGFLDLHRDTSEWSAQGLSNTASALVEIAHRLSWQALIIESKKREPVSTFEATLSETVPILSGGVRRYGLDSEDGAWSGRTVEVGRVLGRWCRFQRALWDIEGNHDGGEET